jgi:hypothetical protein
MMAESNDVDIERLLADEHAKAHPKRLPALAVLPREFTSHDGERYRLDIPGIAVIIEIDRLRRDRNELIGELSVWCDLPGCNTVNGALSISDFNVSSARARQDRARLLQMRSNTGGALDWNTIVEEFCQRVLQADRKGAPAVDLRELDRPNPDEDLLFAEGVALPRRHPTIMFGDGGTCKSYLAMLLAGRMAETGMPVAYFDWELSGEDHRDRLERLFGDRMPRIYYARCERPLVYEVDRLRRIVSANAIQFAVFDSVAFAADGPPESAEIAGKYFRAVRQIGGGSLHIAHITKGENGDKKPFGSAFWHNGARSTWFVQLADGSAESDVLQIGLFNRKSNLGRLRPALGFSITFTDQATTFRRTDVADSPELAGQLSVRQRMVHLLRRGAFSCDQIADEIDADVETVKRTARRYRRLFVAVDGGKVGLLDRTTQ